MIEETMIHPETGKILYRDIRSIEYTYKNQKMTVDQPGWFPLDKSDDDGVLSQEDAKVTDYVLKILKARAKAKENNFALGNIAFA